MREARVVYHSDTQIYLFVPPYQPLQQIINLIIKITFFYCLKKILCSIIISCTILIALYDVLLSPVARALQVACDGAPVASLFWPKCDVINRYTVDTIPWAEYFPRAVIQTFAKSNTKPPKNINTRTPTWFICINDCVGDSPTPRILHMNVYRF